MQSNVLALWRVSAPTVAALKEEAKSDALLFWDDPQQKRPELIVTHATPNKIDNGRIESWKAWAALLCGDITLELLSRIIVDQEQQALALYSLRSSQGGQPIPLL